MGDQCNKKGKRLGWDEKEDDARARISNHLTQSTHHNLGVEEADMAAAQAELVEETWVAPPPKAWVEPNAKSKGRGKWSNDGWGSSSWRSEPYPAAAPAVVAAGMVALIWLRPGTPGATPA